MVGDDGAVPEGGAAGGLGEAGAVVAPGHPSNEEDDLFMLLTYTAYTPAYMTYTALSGAVYVIPLARRFH